MKRLLVWSLLSLPLVACRPPHVPEAAPPPEIRSVVVWLVDENGETVPDVPAHIWWSENEDAEWGNADGIFENGKATIEKVPSGPFTLVVLPPGFVVPTEGCPRQVVPAGVTEARVVYDVGESRTIRILGWREGVYGSLYLAAKEDLEPSQHGVEDDGTVQLEGLRPGVRYNVYVRDYENRRCALLMDLSADEPWPHIELASAKDVTGTIVFPEGCDYMNVAILVGRAVMIDGSCESGGRFTIRAVPPGTFTVVAYTNVGDEYYAETAPASAGDELTIDLTD